MDSGSFEIGVEFTEVEAEERGRLVQLLKGRATQEASVFATSLAIELDRLIDDRRAEEPLITIEDALSALDLVRLRLEERIG